MLELSPARTFNVIDYLFVRDSVANGETDGGLDKVRAIVAEVYDTKYNTMKDLYGEANDNDDFAVDDDERVDPPFEQFSPRGNTRPSSHVYTPQDENGFAGLEPPVG